MGKQRKQGFSNSVYQSLTVIMQFGIYMLVPILGMSALGYYLDRKLGTSWIIILCFFVGAIAGGQNVYKLAMKIANSPGKRQEENIINRRQEKHDKPVGTDQKK